MEVSSGLFFPAPAQAPGKEFRRSKRLLTAVPVSRALTFAAQMEFGVLNLGSVSSAPTASHTLPYPRQAHPRFSEKETEVLSG